MHRLPAIIALLVLLALGGAPHAVARPDWNAEVGSWGYWLQEADIQTLADSPYDLLVIDYSYHGGDASAYTREQIAQLQAAGKRVLCYFSIGEAEDYRFYWQEGWTTGSPDFLGPENPHWEGNFKVKYWVPSWWELALKPYLDRVRRAGFDGVYLDLIDSYDYWAQHGENRRQAADRMVRLVNHIARYGRERQPEFMVCPQNGMAILDDASPASRKAYLQIIDMIGLEELFYTDYPDYQTYRFELLDQFVAAGKTVLNIEYIPADKHGEYRERLQDARWRVIGYPGATDAALDELVIWVPPELSPRAKKRQPRQR